MIHFANRLDELVVEIKVVRLSSHELPCAQESLYQQTVQLRGGIEVIALARLRCVGRIGRGQLRNPSQDGVGAACTKSGMQ